MTTHWWSASTRISRSARTCATCSFSSISAFRRIFMAYTWPVSFFWTSRTSPKAPRPITLRGSKSSTPSLKNYQISMTILKQITWYWIRVNVLWARAETPCAKRVFFPAKIKIKLQMEDQTNFVQNCFVLFLF